MTIIDELYALADREDIPVYCFELPKARCLSYMDSEGNCSIGIDPMYIESYAEEAELLAHELGHCMTGSFYNAQSPLDVRQKHENHADLWMVSRLAPASRISRLMKEGQCESWQLAESLGVTQHVVEKALSLYAAKGML
ncbi:MAG: hypothetical protein IJF53_03870 [Clostridia bacterium]|nr:hypothetical protein [Clostridia bacterium]MBQ3062493.1 hypothetical protein [Clostridia bacterium]